MAYRRPCDRNVLPICSPASNTLFDGIPVFLFLPAGLTTRIIVLCLTSLPLALVALIGISGESLSSFLLIFLKYVRNRRIVGGKEAVQEGREAFGKGGKKTSDWRTEKWKKEYTSSDEGKPGTGSGQADLRKKHTEDGLNVRQTFGAGAGWENSQDNFRQTVSRRGKTELDSRSTRSRKTALGGISGWKRTGEEDFPEEFDQVRGYEIRQKLYTGQSQKRQASRGVRQDGKHAAGIRAAETEKQSRTGRRGNPGKKDFTQNSNKAAQKKEKQHDRKAKNRQASSKASRMSHMQPHFQNPVAEYLPISEIRNGIIYTKDHRYVKVVEVIPINFLLRSAREVSHASDLEKRNAECKRERRKKKHEAAVKRLEKKPLETGYGQLQEYSLDRCHADKWLGEERIAQLEEQRKELEKEKAEQPVQMSLADSESGETIEPKEI